MTRSSLLIPLALGCGLALTACGDKAEVDTDGDGLSDVQEAELGSDPTLADSDGDGLEDGAEVEAGSDPLSVDSDADTYEDGWEVTEGTDPVNADSRIYTGYWPYQPDKASYAASDWSSFVADSGDPMPATVLMDQYGEPVDIFDFAGQDKYVMIDVSAMWCGPCNGISSWLTGGPDDYGWDSYWPEIKDLVQGQHIYWVTVMIQDYYGDLPDLDDLQTWFDMYDDPYVPILADTELWYGIAPAYPSMYLFDSDLTLVQGPGGVNHYKPMDELAARADDIMAASE